MLRLHRYRPCSKIHRERLKIYVEDMEMPIEVVELHPEVDQTFWVNLIGRGYPTPVREFRWCTDRMKIRPSANFITEKIGKEPVVHFLLGTRFDESSARSKLWIHTHVETRIYTHTDSFQPHQQSGQSKTGLQKMWEYLLKMDWVNGMPNPFADINQDLSILYRDAAGGECPVIHDASQQTCAGSRFGCWTCTVVAEDKSLNQMINTDKEIYDVKTLIELANFRDQLLAERNLKENRVQGRNRKGRVQVKRDGTTGVGPYTHQYRQNLLTRLKDVQEKVGLILITQAEIHRIEEIWAEEIAELALLDAGVIA